MSRRINQAYERACLHARTYARIVAKTREISNSLSLLTYRREGESGDPFSFSFSFFLSFAGSSRARTVGIPSWLTGIRRRGCLGPRLWEPMVPVVSFAFPCAMSRTSGIWVIATEFLPLWYHRPSRRLFWKPIIIEAIPFLHTI